MQPRAGWSRNTAGFRRSTPLAQLTTSTGACTTVSATMRLPVPGRPASYTLMVLGGLSAGCCGRLPLLLTKPAPLLVLAPARLPRGVPALPAPPEPAWGCETAGFDGVQAVAANWAAIAAREHPASAVQGPSKAGRRRRWRRRRGRRQVYHPARWQPPGPAPVLGMMPTHPGAGPGAGGVRQCAGAACARAERRWSPIVRLMASVDCTGRQGRGPGRPGGQAARGASLGWPTPS